MTSTEETSAGSTAPDRGSLVGIDYGPVASLTLNRPEARNALSTELCNAIVDSLDEIQRRDESRVVILRGSGKAFCSGADFAAVSGPGALEFLPAFEQMLESVARSRLPVVARLHGAALGGGLQLAIASDFRVASSDASVGIPSSRLGIVVNFENVQRLVLLVGPARAKEVLITARTYDGVEAFQAGLVSEVTAPDLLDGRVARLAEEIARMAPLSVQGSKKAIQAVLDYLSGARRSAPDPVAEVDRLVEQAYRSSDLVEGLKALAEKRSPNFRGR
ncbi:MAG: enoyl-CoA hydratase/isomerase family protein [Actinomycetota bacterium]|nr:enoyl-CoA hydratase/isomerase family protein [Actinomycetota bacterium]